MLDVSILIVNWNTCQITLDCLRSIYEQTKAVSFEVIVVDNASTDDSVKMIRSQCPQATLIENTENRGFAAANNQAMGIAQGRYWLLLNSDTVVLDHAIEKTVAFADTHPDAAVIGCRVLNADKTLQPTCFMYPGLLNLILAATGLAKLMPRSRFWGRERMGYWNRNDSRPVQVVTGCFMLVKKEAAEQVGVMDECFFMYAEETDWCYRFAKAGWQCLFTPAAEIIHLGGASSKKVRPEMIIQLRKSILLFIKKHRSRCVYVMSKYLIVVWFSLRIPYWKVVSLCCREKADEANMTAKAYRQGVREIVSQ